MAAPLRQGRYDLVVAGGGVTGLTAAWHAADRGLSVLLAEAAPQFGGQIATVAQVEGVAPGTTIAGPDFAASLYGVARDAGVRFLTSSIEAVEAGRAGLMVRHQDGFALGRTVLIATGGASRRLDVPGEAEFEGRGVGHCATCDGPLCRGRDVVVVGGGDGALQEALVLARYAGRVTVVIRSRARARRAYLERAETRPNLRFLWNYEVAEIRGTAGGVEVVSLRDRDGTSSELPCFAIFPKIGSVPNVALAQGLCSLDSTGRIVTDVSFETDRPGIFAAGAVRAGYSGDVVTAASEGALAARAIAGRLRPSP